MTALVKENLPLLAGAPNGISKVRELVLGLAVRGKLSEQPAEDGCASDLIAQIEQARSMLIGQGLLKAQKELPEVAPKDAPFGIPGNWVWTRLGAITNFGTADKRGAIEPDSWILDLEDIEKDTSKLLRKLRFAERQSLSDKNGFAAGDVLYGKLRPYLNKVIVADEPGFCTTEILPFRCHGPWHAGYFKIALQSPYFLSYVNGKSYGMKMPRLGTEDGRMAVLPLPPLEEQHRIVAKVDELMALCDRLEAEQADAEAAHAKLVEALLASLTQARDAADFRASWQQLAEHFHTLFTTEASVDALKQTVLQLAVTGRLLPLDAPFPDDTGESIGAIPLPRHWDVVPFNDLVDQDFPIAYGVLVPGPEDADGVPFVRIADLSLNAPPQLPEKRISREVDAKFSRTRLVGGEILMGVVGSIGKLGIAPPSWAGANIARAICRIVPAPTVSREFVVWLLQSDLMRNQFIGDTRTLAQPTLNVGLIRAARTPLPPLDEQQRIVVTIDRLMALCDELKRSLVSAGEHHENLASALVAQAIA